MRTLTSTDPGHCYAVIGEIAQSTREEVKAAVEAARKAFPLWKTLPIAERASYYKKLLLILERQADEIARMQTLETGKTISQSKNDVAGNTVVAKHSEECPLTSKLLNDLFIEAGFPRGVLTMLYGDGSVGRELVEEEIDLLHFTGSSKVGRELYKIAAQKFIPVILEMGGSSPGIIFADADMPLATRSVCTERYRNCGQICCALRRLFVQREAYNDVIEALAAQVRALKPGDPLDDDTSMGPLVAERQLVLMEEQVTDAIRKGAKVVCGGKRPEGLYGAYFEPTLLTNITQDMRVYTEEVFGPALTVMPFDTEAEAIELANNTIYGLSAFVYTKDIARARRVTAALDVGNVSINGASYFTDNAPFGGYKKSGIGSTGGKYGFYHVTHMKTVAGFDFQSAEMKLR